MLLLLVSSSFSSSRLPSVSLLPSSSMLVDLPSKQEKRPPSIRPTFKLFQRQHRETTDRRGGAHMWVSERIDTILNRTGLLFADVAGMNH